MSAMWLSLLAGGAFVAVLPTGALLLAAAGIPLAPCSRLVAALVRLACGGLAWSVALVLLAVGDAFQPAMIGAAGWLLVIGWAVLRYSKRSGHPASPQAGLAWPGWIVVAVLALSAVLYAGWPKESLIAERDEAIYTLHAMHLLRTGENRIDMTGAALAGSATAATMAASKPLELPGIYPTGSHWTFQFSALPSAWMAQMAATFGDAGLFRFNALLGVLTALVFLALLLEWLPAGGAPWALAATAAFALNPAQVWVSRVNLSEPLAQWFTLSGLLLAVLAFRQGSVRLAWLAGAVVGASVLVRIDALLNVLLVAAAFPAAWALRLKDPASTRVWLPLVLGALVVAGASLLHYVFNVQSYWNDHARYLQPLLLVAPPLALAVGVAARARASWLPEPAIRPLLAIACVALVALFGYAALLRPQALPHSLLDSALVPQLRGLRDYREISLHNLAAYLGWPVLLAALCGYIGLLWKLGRTGAGPAGVLLATVFLGVSGAFLWNPMISPDHVWASRRFVPVVIPGTLALAAWMLAHASRRLPARLGLVLAAVLGALVSGHMLWAQRHTLRFAEDQGLLASLRTLDASLPAGQRVFVEGSTLAATLLAGFGKDALPLLDGDLALARATRDDVARGCRAAQPCVWLSAPGAVRPGWQVEPLDAHRLPRQRIAATPIALATEVHASEWPLQRQRLTGLAAVDEDRRIGGHRDWRIAEEGFWHDEFGPEGATRWTNGHARLRVPALPSRAIVVTLQLPADATTALEIGINGQVMFEGATEGGRRSFEFAPPPATPDGHWLFELRSDRFVAAERYGGADQRQLGVKLESIRLLAPKPAPAWSAGASLRADLALSEARDGQGLPGARLLGVRNTGNWSWPSLGDAAPGEAPVQIGLLWVARGASPASTRLLEQRMPLPHRLEPGEDVLLPIALDPTGPDGAKLPAADYDVIVSPVLEGIAWFHDHGVAPLRIPVDAAEIP